MVHKRINGGRLLFAAASVIAIAASVMIVPGITAEAAVSATSRAAIAKGYLTKFEPAVATPVEWTGSTSGCQVGEESAASKAATVKAINYARALAGLSSVTLNTATSAKAQKAALVYLAQGDLSHTPSTVAAWPCGTKAAGTAAENSNIALGYAGANAVNGYLDDPGAGNEVVGHRRWILDPATKTVGTGSTDNTNALWVTDVTATSFKNPSWVAWPSAGYFPSQLEPDGRWSLSANAAFKFSFAKARVSVKNAAGTAMKVATYKQSDGFGNDTLVWEVNGVKAPSGTSAVANYTVTVTGITKAGSAKKLSHTYTVKMFDPTAG